MPAFDARIKGVSFSIAVIFSYLSNELLYSTFMNWNKSKYTLDKIRSR